MAGLLSLGLASGCATTGSSTGSSGGELQKKPELLCDRAGAERIDEGSWRGKSRPDVARVFVKSTTDGARGTVLACREVDLNGDGRKDSLVYYDPSGRKVREEFDQDYDGRADLTAFYEEGRLIREEIDGNFDGKADLVNHYEQGRMMRVERIGKAPSFGSSSAVGSGSSAGQPGQPGQPSQPGPGSAGESAKPSSSGPGTVRGSEIGAQPSP